MPTLGNGTKPRIDVNGNDFLAVVFASACFLLFGSGAARWRGTSVL